ncbi:hypothetical protein CYMTET_55893 [Cymbomonas tetramitiformis]|uniref:Uncharacterized protein n=1 Tax=Cymbomonas tetramitiformis TaxID=36881 RepID=A0AAE0BDH7_9CHLO|nr:hypothetical protein CYMTET_55893 [Cymbomonas tetramitiformis]
MTGRVYLFATLLLAAPVVGSASDDCTPDYTASVGQFETAFEYWSGHANNPKNDPYGNTPDNADAGTTTGACDDEYLHMIARYMSAYETYEYRKTNSYTSAPTGTPTLSPSSTPTLSPSSPPTLAPSVATTAEADGVAFTITFSNLDINSFSNETFAASFNSAFRDQMAKTANVSWEYVTILEISSGSVAVSVRGDCDSPHLHFLTYPGSHSIAHFRANLNSTTSAPAVLTSALAFLATATISTSSKPATSTRDYSWVWELYDCIEWQHRHNLLRVQQPGSSCATHHECQWIPRYYCGFHHRR